MQVLLQLVPPILHKLRRKIEQKQQQTNKHCDSIFIQCVSRNQSTISCLLCYFKKVGHLGPNCLKLRNDIILPHLHCRAVPFMGSQVDLDLWLEEVSFALLRMYPSLNDLPLG